MNPNTWSVNELVIVTRGGCANTPVMQANLETALRTLGLPVGFHLVDLDLLAGTDVLTGYPTPTLLFRGRDVFGMPKPKPLFPEPALRIYPDGVPSAAAIARQLRVVLSL